MSELFMKILYCLAYGIVVFVAGFVMRVVVPYVNTKLKSTQYEWAAQIIENAVRAYEQMYESKPHSGTEKFYEVTKHVYSELNKVGIALSREQVALLVEAAVQTMNAEKAKYEELGVSDLPELVSDEVNDDE